MTVRIMVGDALSQLAELPDESVHCVVTSPPYWGLRAYKGDPGMIGLEPTFDKHLENIVAVFREVRRVLRSDGVCFVNYGDSYWPGGPNNFGWKAKDLMGMPALVATELMKDGYYRRSEIIWHKPNPMPESATDRPTSAHEKMFLLSKSARYFYDAEAVRADVKMSSLSRYEYGLKSHPRGDSKSGAIQNERMGDDITSSGANLRNVWTIPTHGYSEAHFATFPPALVEPCIKAGTSAHGVCGECGAPWVRRSSRPQPPDDVFGVAKDADGLVRRNMSGGVKRTSGGQLQKWYDENPPETTGWSPTCDHNVLAVRATCLDPFGGSGTVGLVADRLQRSAILIEISPEYATMAHRRIENDAGGLFSPMVAAT